MIRYHVVEGYPFVKTRWKVSSRRIPRGYIDFTREYVREHHESRYEASTKYVLVDFYRPVALDRKTSGIRYRTREQAVSVLMSHERFRAIEQP